MSLLDSDGPCYDPDLYASLGDDARKAARENAVTPAYEGEVGQDDGTNDDYFQRPCTCTLACVGAQWLTEDYYCHEQRSCENTDDEVREALRLIGWARFNNGKGKSGAVETLLGKADAALARHLGRR